jgi:hypothetical protein
LAQEHGSGSGEFCVLHLRRQITTNIDRPGGDYTNITLPPGSVSQVCLNLCSADAPCKAWTYVKPGVQAPNPRCWLKNTVPEARANSCCTSGVK